MSEHYEQDEFAVYVEGAFGHGRVAFVGTESECEDFIRHECTQSDNPEIDFYFGH